MVVGTVFPGKNEDSMHIAYFVTGHGYGHGVRSTNIANRFPPDVEVTFFTSLPETFFQEEMIRPFRYRYCELDCGCIQRDCVHVNIPETLDTYMHIAGRNEANLDNYTNELGNRGITAVLSDATPFAFDIAANLRLPSAAVTNFSWHDIYQPYVGPFPQFEPYLKDIERQYLLADAVLALEPSNALTTFRKRIGIGMPGRVGQNRRPEILRHFGINPQKKLALVYVGGFGLESAQWHRLSELEEWEFLGVYPLPDRLANYHLIAKSDFRYADLSASVDAVCGKIGYGVYTECVINDVPLLYVPREEFAEHPVLESALREKGLGYRVEYPQFRDLEWKSVLDTIARYSHTRTPESNQTGALGPARAILCFLDRH